MEKLLHLIQEAYDADDEILWIHRDGVLAFRGTEVADDWLINSYVVKREYQLNLGSFSVPGGMVHAGFLHRWETLRSEVLAAVGEPKAITVTGHSLGGAMAALAAIELDAAGFSAKLVTFGAPRIGDSDFTRLLNHNLKDYQRIENWGDPVPWIPTYTRGWRHAGKMRLVGSPLNLIRFPQTQHHAVSAYREACQ